MAPAPKKKLLAVIKPPANIATMTQAERHAFADKIFVETIKPAQDAAKQRQSKQQ